MEYIKDSSADAVLLTRLLQEYGDRLGMFNGADTLSFCALAAGARGAVWGAANFIPELTVELYHHLVVEKDLDAARAVWDKIWPICHILESTNYASAVKTACELAGVPAGPTRHPVRLLDDDGRKQLATALANAGVTG